MDQNRYRLFLLCASILVAFGSANALAQTRDPYLSWTADQAVKIGKEMRVSDRIGKAFDLRLINTDKAINYKLRVTWLTPEVIRASARLEQLRSRLSDQETIALVKEAEAAGDTVFLIEIDPREGSGVIPLDWRVLLQPVGPSESAITGIKSPSLRKVKALSSVLRRDYDYDIFWVVFPLVDADKKPVLTSDIAQVQLVVGIYGNEATITWSIPSSVRDRIKTIAENK